MIKKLVLLICIALPCVCSAKGMTTKQTDSFEVAGVKIGMSDRQAIEAVAKKYNVPESKIKIYKDVKGATWYFDLKTDNDESIHVVFDDDITVNPSVKVVDTVEYGIPGTPANNKALKDSLVKKYGEKSFSAPSGLIWCQEKEYKCIEGTTILSLKTTGIANSHIKITNNRYAIAKRKLEEAKRNRKPNF